MRAPTLAQLRDLARTSAAVRENVNRFADLLGDVAGTTPHNTQDYLTSRLAVGCGWQAITCTSNLLEPDEGAARRARIVPYEVVWLGAMYVDGSFSQKVCGFGCFETQGVILVLPKNSPDLPRDTGIVNHNLWARRARRMYEYDCSKILTVLGSSFSRNEHK
jgi:hypothetical protein